MHLILTSTVLIALAGCSIQNKHPNYEYPKSSRTTGTDWPKLAVTSELVLNPKSVQSQAQVNQVGADHLASRANALRVRTERLRHNLGN